VSGRSIEPFRDVGRRLAEVRRERGVTQKRLAELLGRPPSYIAKLELAERRLDVIDLTEIARGLGISAPELLGRLLPDI
jgi:transcriptional regulator with XRE-family HTH domain